MSYYIESTMGDPQEMAKIRFEDDGMVSIVVGTQSNGQGHATAYAQVLVDRLGVPFEKIQMVEGDTRELKLGGGTGGSRSLTAEGLAIRAASEIVIDQGKHYASQEFETAVADIEFSREDGEFKVSGTDRKISVLELAAKSKSMESPRWRRHRDGRRSHRRHPAMDVPERLPRRRGRGRSRKPVW